MKRKIINWTFIYSLLLIANIAMFIQIKIRSYSIMPFIIAIILDILTIIIGMSSIRYDWRILKRKKQQSKQ